MDPLYKAVIQETLKRYAWPGGYPLFMVVNDGGVLCPNCVKSEIHCIVDAARRWDEPGRQAPSDIAQWLPLATDINWEDPSLYCDHCGERIESAYAEEEE